MNIEIASAFLVNYPITLGMTLLRMKQIWSIPTMSQGDRACENGASDLGLNGSFLWALQFPSPYTTG